MREFLYGRALGPMLLAGYRWHAGRNEKAREFFAIRSGMMERIAETAGKHPEGKWVVVHVASVGELLQAMPVMAAIKALPNAPLVALSYTSPSVARNFPKNVVADLITPSPLDLPGPVSQFLDLLHPGLIIFSTYDLWPGFVGEAQKRAIPMTLINASLPENSGRLRFPARIFYRSLYSGLQAVGAVTEADARRHGLLGVAPARVQVTGNCRFDQTLARCRAVADGDPDVAALPEAEFMLIAGSTWPEDHVHLLPVLESLLARHAGMKAVIAPHEPSPEHVIEVENFFASRGIPTARYTLLREAKTPPARVVIVDCVGVLYKLYKKGHAAYVGGSFKQGVHSVMEPAGMGLPVVAGPKHENSAEALQMLKTGGALVAHGRPELETVLENLLTDPDRRARAGASARAVVESSAGATARTMKLLRNYVGS